MTYTHIVGLDIGSSQTKAVVSWRVGEQWQSRRLQLDGRDSTALPVCISCPDADTMHSADAFAPDAISGLRQCPDWWNHAADEAHTVGTLLQRYIHDVFAQILRWNPPVLQARQEGTLLLRVSLPVAAAWCRAEAMARYQALLQEATGCEHVELLPEPSAALLAVAGGHPLNFDEGVAVYCLGGSMQLGYYRSGEAPSFSYLDIGCDHLDRAMLLQVLAQHRIASHRLHGYYHSGQLTAPLAQLREAREAFCRSGRVTHRAVAAPIRLEPQDAPVTQMLHYTMDEAFLQAALTAYYDREHSNRPLLAQWEQFLTGTRERFQPSQGTVILAGGGSQIPALRELFLQQFPGAIVAEQPETAVAAGLSLDPQQALRPSLLAALARQSGTDESAFLYVTAQCTQWQAMLFSPGQTN